MVAFEICIMSCNRLILNKICIIKCLSTNECMFDIFDIVLHPMPNKSTILFVQIEFAMDRTKRNNINTTMRNHACNCILLCAPTNIPKMVSPHQWQITKGLFGWIGTIVKVHRNTYTRKHNLYIRCPHSSYTDGEKSFNFG